MFFRRRPVGDLKIALSKPSDVIDFNEPFAIKFDGYFISNQAPLYVFVCASIMLLNIIIEKITITFFIFTVLFKIANTMLAVFSLSRTF